MKGKHITVILRTRCGCTKTIIRPELSEIGKVIMVEFEKGDYFSISKGEMGCFNPLTYRRFDFACSSGTNYFYNESPYAWDYR
jgi:SET domain-containing protein